MKKLIEFMFLLLMILAVRCGKQSPSMVLAPNATLIGTWTCDEQLRYGEIKKIILTDTGYSFMLATPSNGHVFTDCGIWYTTNYELILVTLWRQLRHSDPTYSGGWYVSSDGSNEVSWGFQYVLESPDSLYLSPGGDPDVYIKQ
jgi:hypothetical protein